jgi:hypothetical protein
VASFDDIFNSNKGTSRFPKWTDEGDVLVGIVTGDIDVNHQQTDFTTKKPAFLVKTDNPKNRSPWEAKGAGTFDVELEHFPLTEVRVPVEIQDKDGNYESFFDFADRSPKYDALKNAMMDSGLPLIKGTAVAVKLLSKKTKPFTWVVKIKAPQE